MSKVKAHVMRMVQGEATDVAALRDFLIQATKNWGTANGYDPPPATEDRPAPPAKAQKLADQLKSQDWGTWREAMITMFSTAIDYDLHPLCVVTGSAGVNVEPSPYACFVPLANRGGHSYPIGVASMYFSTSMAGLKASGATGNSMDAAKVSQRPATEEEIGAFVMSLRRSVQDPV